VQAVGVLAASANPIAALQLIGSMQDLSTWFKAQPTPFYFSPTAISPDAATMAEQQAMAAARTRLPAELDALAGHFSATDLYVTPELRAAYVSDDGTVVRLYVTTSTNPYDTKSFDTVRDIRALLATDPGHFGVGGTGGGDSPAAQAYLGGSTAEFADVQDTISADFLRVAAITIVGILIVLMLLLRAVVAPVYLVLTVLLSYATSLSISALILQHLFGQAGMNYFIPLMVFVLLVALGSDYNIFLMSRVREESASRELRSGIRIASARTGTVITSAGLILAGTFGALVTSPLQLLFQVGLTVALGVLIDTFVVRSLLVPAITAFIGERAWWPFHRRRGPAGRDSSA
jgi:RND superfamily putative drug exporter